MADGSRTSHDLPRNSPHQTPHERPGSMSFGNVPSPAAEGVAPVEKANGASHGPGAGVPPSGALDGAEPEMSQQGQQVQDVLVSDIGVATMLNRLKQSIASAKEFANFLKKRSVLEEDHAKGMKKLCRTNQDNAHHADHRQGTFAQSYGEMLNIHDRMAENGIQFALSLHQMHEDLLEVAAMAEKHRKGWKQNGLAAEQRLTDIENAMRKSKTKYDSLAEEYDRVRTGEARGGPRVFGIKGPKSAAQQEEDLLRKVQAADTDYMGKVQNYQSEKATMVASTRPEAIKALQDLVRECDSGTTLQMQKFASFNEKLLLSNGLVISPLKRATLPGQPSRSLKEVIQAIDNQKDLQNYITSFHSKLPAKVAEPKYERNPVLNPQQNISLNQMTPAHHQQNPSQSQPPQTQPPPLQTQFPPPGPLGRAGTFDTNSSPMGQSPSSFKPPNLSAGQRSNSGLGHERSYSHGAMLTQSNHQPPQQPHNVRNSTQALPGQSRFASGGGNSAMSPQAGGPPQLGALPFQSQQSRAHSQSPQQPGGYPKPAQPQHATAPGLAGNPPGGMPGPGGKGNQVFGVSLARLYERDQFAVPMVMHQCIQAVDLYGLAVEGIYRLSGSQAHVNKLKSLFDTDQQSHILDFRNPENFFHDVNSVAGLLKQFLRDLPEPLLTSEQYAGFIEAAKHDDDIVRRDSLHAIINGLPDPNYATLRALTLHLHRVTENSAVNRMNSQNLAIVFGPTLMGTAPGSNIADAGWQCRVVDTILQNTYQIFDED
ncbi:hypothetical protein GGR56DRAFT_641457 [Xylariaceae sp. FL0804]|nr:hypothetical protein GGR56DRAFT_641457 [Xylariaceae sp. FL0804]